MEELVIDPKTWFRGQGPDSMLRNPKGQMCCLGFYCLSRGKSAAEITGKRYPSYFVNHTLAGFQYAVFKQEADPHADLEGRIATINDDFRILVTPEGDQERIAKLQPWFERLGVRLVLGPY